MMWDMQLLVVDCDVGVMSLMRWMVVDAVLHPVFAEWVSYSQQSLPSRGWQVVTGGVWVGRSLVGRLAAPPAVECSRRRAG